MTTTNPFFIGQRVIFYPDERAMGWHQHSFDRWGLLPGDAGEITSIDDDVNVVVDGKTEAAMHWSQFRAEDSVSAEERATIREMYQSRLR